jgi:N-carbamoyl-L-amino-acid hydrolase
MAEFPDCVVNTGQARFWPGAYNIIPGRVELALEYRSPAIHQFTELEKVLLACARQAAEQFGLLVHCEQRGWHAPAPMSVRVQEAISQAAQDLGLPTLVLASGAGHDGQMLAAICPSGMIFIPSQGGISHAPQEFSHWEDCVNGANVLLQAALKLVVPVPPAELA